MSASIDPRDFLALTRARWLLLDRLTRRMVLVAHGVEAGGWSEAPFPVRVAEVTTMGEPIAGCEVTIDVTPAGANVLSVVPLARRDPRWFPEILAEGGA